MAKFKDAPKFLYRRLGEAIEPDVRDRAIKAARSFSFVDIDDDQKVIVVRPGQSNRTSPKNSAKSKSNRK
jgi:hypothetical protein